MSVACNKVLKSLITFAMVLSETQRPADPGEGDHIMTRESTSCLPDKVHTPLFKAHLNIFGFWCIYVPAIRFI